MYCIVIDLDKDLSPIQHQTDVYCNTCLWMIKFPWIHVRCQAISRSWSIANERLRTGLCFSELLSKCHIFPWWNLIYMMTSSNGNIFRVTDPFCGEFTGPVEFPTQRPVTQSVDVFYLRLNKRLSKQPWGWWFDTPSWLSWRQCNGNAV